MRNQLVISIIILALLIISPVKAECKSLGSPPQLYCCKNCNSIDCTNDCIGRENDNGCVNNKCQTVYFSSGTPTFDTCSSICQPVSNGFTYYCINNGWNTTNNCGTNTQSYTCAAYCESGTGKLCLPANPTCQNSCTKQCDGTPSSCQTCTPSSCCPGTYSCNPCGQKECPADFCVNQYTKGDYPSTCDKTCSGGACDCTCSYTQVSCPIIGCPANYCAGVGSNTPYTYPTSCQKTCSGGSCVDCTCTATAGTPCTQAQRCQDGVCMLCSGTWRNCNFVSTDGCEMDTNSNPDNCGGCGVSCPSCGATCSGDQLTSGGTRGCSSGGCICSGSTTSICDSNHLKYCSAGSCAQCPASFANCDEQLGALGQAGNGCEVNIYTSTSNCGSCGNNCGTNSVCNAGVCGCQSGFANCDGSWTNGCEKNLNVDNQNCGGCGNICGSQGTTSTCSLGDCVCDSTHKRCSEDYSTETSCLTDITSISNCGNCEVTCNTGTMKEICSGGCCTPTGATGISISSLTCCSGGVVKQKYDLTQSYSCCGSNQCWGGTGCKNPGELSSISTDDNWVCDSGIWVKCDSSNVCQSIDADSTPGNDHYCMYDQTGQDHDWSADSATVQQGRVCSGSSEVCDGQGNCVAPVGACQSCTSDAMCTSPGKCDTQNQKCMPGISWGVSCCGCSGGNCIQCPVPTGKSSECVSLRCDGFNQCGWDPKGAGISCGIPKTCPASGCELTSSTIIIYPGTCTKKCDGQGACPDCTCTPEQTIQLNSSYYCLYSTSITGTPCQSGWKNCYGGSGDGCETQLGTVTACADCGNTCTGEQPACCSKVCADLKSSNTNCGNCGVRCSGTQSCVSGKCCTKVGETCSKADECCSGSCVAGKCEPLSSCTVNGVGCGFGGRSGQCALNCTAGDCLLDNICCDSAKGEMVVLDEIKYRCVKALDEKYSSQSCFLNFNSSSLGAAGKVRRAPGSLDMLPAGSTLYGCCPTNATSQPCWSGKGYSDEGVNASLGTTALYICAKGGWEYCNQTRWCDKLGVGNVNYYCGENGWVKTPVDGCGGGYCVPTTTVPKCVRCGDQVKVGQPFEGILLSGANVSVYCSPSGFLSACEDDLDCDDLRECTNDKCAGVGATGADTVGCKHELRECGSVCSQGVCDVQGNCTERKQVGESCISGCETCAVGLGCKDGLCSVLPGCGNGVCDAGECSTCDKDCGLEQCKGDGLCSPLVGENCENSKDCECKVGTCDPKNPAANKEGCVVSACGDGKCRAAECSFCTEDCKPASCTGNGVCDIGIGENCGNSADCFCKSDLAVPGEVEVQRGSKKVVSFTVKNDGNSKEKYVIELKGSLNTNWEKTTIELDPGQESLQQVEVWSDQAGYHFLNVTVSNGKKISKSISLTIPQPGAFEAATETMTPVFNVMKWYSLIVLIIGGISAWRYLGYRFGQKHLVVPLDEKTNYFHNRFYVAHPQSYQAQQYQQQVVQPRPVAVKPPAKVVKPEVKRFMKQW